MGTMPERLVGKFIHHQRDNGFTILLGKHRVLPGGFRNVARAAFEVILDEVDQRIGFDQVRTAFIDPEADEVEHGRVVGMGRFLMKAKVLAYASHINISIALLR
jgi:hypothetical protein